MTGGRKSFLLQAGCYAKSAAAATLSRGRATPAAVKVSGPPRFPFGPGIVRFVNNVFRRAPPRV